MKQCRETTKLMLIEENKHLFRTRHSGAVATFSFRTLSLSLSKSIRIVLAHKNTQTYLLVFCVGADNIKFALPPNHRALVAV